MEYFLLLASYGRPICQGFKRQLTEARGCIDSQTFLSWGAFKSGNSFHQREGRGGKKLCNECPVNPALPVKLYFLYRGKNPNIMCNTTWPLTFVNVAQYLLDNVVWREISSIKIELPANPIPPSTKKKKCERRSQLHCKPHNLEIVSFLFYAGKTENRHVHLGAG